MSVAPTPLGSLADPDRRRWFDDARGLVVLWGAFAGIYLLVILAGAREPYDGDDLVRLQQVRDLLAGQNWFDVTQYRMNPPAGAAMHWSRLVDLPLAGAMLLLGLVLPPAIAEFWASALVPMAYLGVALVLLRAIFLCLGFSSRLALSGLVLAVLFPLLPAAFAPMRIDHHSPQAVLALTCAWLLLRAPDRSAALLCGLAAAAWLVISLEGLPLVALLAALYGWRYLVRADRSLGLFLLALALAAPTLSLVTRSAGEFAQWCDILLPAHWVAFAAGATIALLIPYLPRQEGMLARLSALGLLPLVCGPLALALLGPCRSGPFAALDPLVENYWYRNVHEGLPIWQQGPDLAFPALYLVALVVAGYWAAAGAGLMASAEQRLRWQLHTALTLGTTCYGLLLMREMLIAQLLALVLALALSAWAMPRARAIGSTLPRVLATFACLMLITPAGAAIIGKQLRSAMVSPKLAQGETGVGPGTAGRCDFARLNALQPAHIFTSFNASPAILARTHHMVEVGGYHRNIDGLRRVISAFIAEGDDARAWVHRSHARLLVACLADDSLQIFAHGRPESLAQQLLDGEPPAWLQPVTGFDNGPLLVYRVR